MRINKKHGVLLCGVNGFKVYTLNNTLKIVSQRISVAVPEHLESTVIAYVNLKYQPLNKHEEIKCDFLSLLKTLADSTDK